MTEWNFGDILDAIEPALPREAPALIHGNRLVYKWLGRPEEIVATALYLASRSSSFTTGAIIRCDGGY